MAAKRRNSAKGKGADAYLRLIEIGIALSAERENNRLMERILLEAKDLCNADGGTLYLVAEDEGLKFEIMRTDSLNIALGGTTGKEITFPPVRLYDSKNGQAQPQERRHPRRVVGRLDQHSRRLQSQRFRFFGHQEVRQRYRLSVQVLPYGAA